jgi:predicted amidohydrolase
LVKSKNPGSVAGAGLSKARRSPANPGTNRQAKEAVTEHDAEDSTMNLRGFLLGIVAALVAVVAVTSADEPSESKSAQSVRVAGIVLKWLRTDKEANFRRVAPLIREAAEHGAKIVCTTECFLDGYAIADKSIPLAAYRDLGEPIPGGMYYERLRGLANELNIHLIAGMLEADGEQRYNTAVLLSPDGKLIGKYHKQKLGHESVRNTAGTTSPVFDTPFGKLGVMICADRTETQIVRRFCTAGADFLICPSGGMFGPKNNDPIVQARSKENGKYIVFVHPAEFLVTAPDGTIARRELVGDRLLIAPEEAGGQQDKHRVFYFDLPLTQRGS